MAPNENDHESEKLDVPPPWTDVARDTGDTNEQYRRTMAERLRIAEKQQRQQQQQ
jgi:hypothetical protein